MDCDWAEPGKFAYTGTARAAIMSYAQIPEPVRRTLVERAERPTPAYDDLATIDREAIRGTYEYAPELTQMHFGAGRRCDTVSRARWAPAHTEFAMVFCEQGWCVARPSVCNNWALVRRLPARVASLLAPVPTFESIAALFEPISPIAETERSPGGTPELAIADEPQPTFVSSWGFAPPTGGFFITGGPGGTPPRSTPPGGGTPPYVVPPEGGVPPVIVPPPVPAVPEPSTWFLLGAGLALLAARRGVLR